MRGMQVLEKWYPPRWAMTAETKNRPNTVIATLLAVIGPWGMGQFYVGQAKRALNWLLVPLFFAAFALAIRPLGSVLGHRLVWCVWVLGLVATWLASLGDIDRVPKEQRRYPGHLAVAGYFVLGAIAIWGLRVGVRNFVIESFKIPSTGGMQPTIVEDDHIFVDKLVLRARQPRRGELVIFESPERRTTHLSRVLGVAGDRLEFKEGHAWINGWEVPHCLVGRVTMKDDEGAASDSEIHVEYLEGSAYLMLSDPQHTSEGPYVVADGEFWVVGDNRGHSYDSRSWFGGKGAGVPFDSAKGVAFVRWFTKTLEGRLDWTRLGRDFATPVLPFELKLLDEPLAKCLAAQPPHDATVPPRSTVHK